MANDPTLQSFGDGPRVLVVGASRGIGLAMARQLAPGARQLWVGARRPDDSDALRTLNDAHPDTVSSLTIDVGEEESVRAAAGRVKAKCDALDLVVNCAGLLHEGDHLVPERKLAHVRPENLQRLFGVHAVGPLLVAKHFASLLPRRERFVFASLSARVGSIGDNRLGGWYGYRVSKAAHNMAIKSVSIELRRRSRQSVCVALHPGTVDTDLSRPFSDNVPDDKVFTAERAAAQLLAIIDRLQPRDTGSFLAWDGTQIPW